MKKSEISQKIKAIIILLCICATQIIIPNMVYAKEYTYEEWSKESTVAAVAASYRGNYRGAAIKKIELVRTEYKYELKKQTKAKRTGVISELTYDAAKKIRDNPSKNIAGDILGIEMLPSNSYNYGDNEYKRYKIKYTVNETKIETVIEDWTTVKKRENDNRKIIDTRYLYKITTESKPTGITDNGEYITQKNGNGDILETTTYDSNGNRKTTTKYSENGRITKKEFFRPDGTLQQIDNYDEDVCTGGIFYENDGKTIKYTSKIERSENGRITKIEYVRPDGTLRSIANYGEYGPKTGIFYEDDGKTIKETYKVEYSENGIITRKEWFRPDGTLYEIENYGKDGQIDTEIQYENDGKTIKETDKIKYSENGRITKTEHVRPDGTLRCIVNFGEYGYTGGIFYENDGKTIKETYKAERSENGILTRKKWFRPDGTLKKMENYGEDGQLDTSIYYENDGKTVRGYEVLNAEEEEKYYNGNNEKITEEQYNNLVDAENKNNKEQINEIDEIKQEDKYSTIFTDTQQTTQPTIQETSSQIEAGETLKFTATAWHTKASDGGSNTGKYIKTGDLLEIVEKGNTSNYYKVKMLSGELIDTETYIIYNSDSSKYFEKVESTKVEETDEKKTETIDKGTLSENVIEFTKKMYMAILGKTKEQADKDITKESLIVKDIVEGKIDAAGLIGYFENLENSEKTYVNLSLEEYAKYMNKAILEKDITDEEISKIKEKYKESQNYQSEILEDIINSEEFKSLCEKYTIKVGTYVPTKFNKDTTEEKATEFVKNLYTTVINKEPSNEEINNIVKYITDGKITASSVLKAFFESDEFKNLKVTDDKYIEILAKACLNKELTENQKKEYTEKLINGTTRNELLKEFMNSDFANICNNYGLTKGNYEPSKLKTTEALATEFIKNVHSAVLGGEAQVGQSLKNSLITGDYSAADLIQIYVESTNFAKRVEVEDMTNSDYVKTLIKACLQREAKSEDEIKQYEDKIDELYKSSVLEEFFKTEEYKKLCNRYYLVAGQYVDNKQNNRLEPTVENYGTGGAKITTKQRTLSNGKTVKSIIKVQFDTSNGIVGDVDGDGNINISDASLILSYVASQELYFEKPTEEVLKVADVDGDKMITVEDAQYVLQYYAMKGAGLNPTWEEAIKAAKEI